MPGQGTEKGTSGSINQCGVIDHKAVLDVTLEHSLVGFIYLVCSNQFDVGDDAVLGTEIQHLLCFRDASDHRADNFVPRYTRKLRACPLGAHLVQIRMADATEGDIDLNIMGCRRAAIDLHRLKGFVASVSAIGLYKHGRDLKGFVGWTFSRWAKASCSAFHWITCLIL